MRPPGGNWHPPDASEPKKNGWTRFVEDVLLEVDRMTRARSSAAPPAPRRRRRRRAGLPRLRISPTRSTPSVDTGLERSQLLDEWRRRGEHEELATLAQLKTIRSARTSSDGRSGPGRILLLPGCLVMFVALGVAVIALGLALYVYTNTPLPTQSSVGAPDQAALWPVDNPKWLQSSNEQGTTQPAVQRIT